MKKVKEVFVRPHCGKKSYWSVAFLGRDVTVQITRDIDLDAIITPSNPSSYNAVADIVKYVVDENQSSTTEEEEYSVGRIIHGLYDFKWDWRGDGEFGPAYYVFNVNENRRD